MSKVTLNANLSWIFDKKHSPSFLTVFLHWVWIWVWGISFSPLNLPFSKSVLNQWRRRRIYLVNHRNFELLDSKKALIIIRRGCSRKTSRKILNFRSFVLFLSTHLIQNSWKSPNSQKTERLLWTPPQYFIWNLQTINFLPISCHKKKLFKEIYLSTELMINISFS